MDNISSLIILRALFILDIIEKGWSVRKSKLSDNIYLYKNVKKEYK